MAKMPGSKLTLACERPKEELVRLPTKEKEDEFNKDEMFLSMLERERNRQKGEDVSKKISETENDASTDGTNNIEGSKNYIDSDEKYPSNKVVMKPSEKVYANGDLDSVLKAEGNASVEDFIEMLGMIISKSNRKDIVFSYDDGDRIKKDPAEVVDKTYITYKIINRKPTKEKKPMVRDDNVREVGVDRHEQRRVKISAQRFCSLVQFDVFSPNYKQATEDMNFLEDTIFSYLHYFKRKGVGEIIFEQQLTDTTLDVYRERASVKSLQYSIKTEKQYVTFEDIIDDFEYTSN